MYLEKDFDNAFFPYFEMTVMVPYWLYNNICVDPEKVTMTLDMKYAMFDGDLEKVPSSWTTDIRGSFKCLFEDISPDADGKWQLVREQDEGVVNRGYASNDLMPVQMILYNNSYYNAHEKQVNAVLSSATPIAALTYVLNQGGIGNVLLSSPDNRSSYKEFKVTPLPVQEQLYRICNDYAFHKTGSVIFFDLDRCYIISKKPECDAFTPNEWTTTHLLSLEQFHFTSIYTGGHYKESKEKINVINILRDSIKEGGGQDEKSSGFTLIDTTNGSVTTVGGSPKGAYVYDDGANSGSILANMSTEKTKTFGCAFSHCVISAFNPNKMFVVTLDNPKLQRLNGKYRILRYSCSFQKEGEWFCPYIVAEFRGE